MAKIDHLKGETIRYGDQVLNVELRRGYCIIRRYRYIGVHHRSLVGCGSITLFESDWAWLRTRLSDMLVEGAAQPSVGSGSEPE